MKSLVKFVQIYKRIEQSPTRFSALVVVLLFGLFLEAYMHDFNLVYITLFFVFALAFTAGPMGILNIGQLEADYLKAGRFFVNQEGKIPLKIHNHSQITSWSILACDTENSIAIEMLKGEDSHIISFPFTPKKRGIFQHENCYLESRYPLSTARLVKPIKSHYKGLAYPEPKGKSLQEFMHIEENHYGEEKEFDGLREYDGSQKLSHMHWPSVAKGELSVKVFSKETSSPKLAFDFYKAGKDDESRLSQLCLWVLTCEKLQLHFSVQMPHKTLISTKESTDVILKYLARY